MDNTWKYQVIVHVLLITKWLICASLFFVSWPLDRKQVMHWNISHTSHPGRVLTVMQKCSYISVILGSHLLCRILTCSQQTSCTLIQAVFVFLAFQPQSHCLESKLWTECFLLLSSAQNPHSDLANKPALCFCLLHRIQTRTLKTSHTTHSSLRPVMRLMMKSVFTWCVLTGKLTRSPTKWVWFSHLVFLFLTLMFVYKWLGWGEGVSSSFSLCLLHIRCVHSVCVCVCVCVCICVRGLSVYLFKSAVSKNLFQIVNKVHIVTSEM